MSFIVASHISVEQSLLELPIHLNVCRFVEIIEGGEIGYGEDIFRDDLSNVF